MSDRQDILRHIIEQDTGHMGLGYNPGTIGNAVADRLGLTAPANPQDFAEEAPRRTGGAMPPPGFAQDLSDPTEDAARAQRQAQQREESARNRAQRIYHRDRTNAETARQLGLDLPMPAPPVPDRPRPTPPGMANSGIPMPEAPDPPPPPGAAVAGGQAGRDGGFQVEPGALVGFTGPSGEYGVQPGSLAGIPDAARGDMATGTPAERAQAGLQAAMQGQSPGVDTMAPEQFDPETGTRTEEARKLGLLERMFGEKGSPEYQAAGRALMMAGAAIMSTDGDLGKALGNGIQAGLMQYDDVLEALREEEMEARQMGMAEEAHAMNMHLKSIQAARAAAGGKRGSLSAEPELTKAQQAAVLADEFTQLGLDPQTSLAGALNRIYGVPATLVRPPSEDPLAAALSGE